MYATLAGPANHNLSLHVFHEGTATSGGEGGQSVRVCVPVCSMNSMMMQLLVSKRLGVVTEI